MLSMERSQVCQAVKLWGKQLENSNVTLQTSHTDTDKDGLAKNNAQLKIFFCRINPNWDHHFASTNTVMLWGHTGRVLAALVLRYSGRGRRLMEWVPHPYSFLQISIIGRLHYRTPSETEMCNLVVLEGNKCHYADYFLALNKPDLWRIFVLALKVRTW